MEGLVIRRILYVQYTNPCAYPPLEHSSRILARDGWKVTFLGTASAGTSSQLTFPPHPMVTVRLWRHAPPGWRQKLHYFAFLAWCFWCIFRLRPNWVYASDHFSYPIGLFLACCGVRVVMHEHDTPAPPRNRFLRALAWCRGRLARKARLCVVPQNQRAERMKAELAPRRIEVVWNCPALEEVSMARESQSKELILWFHGSIVPDQLPVTVVQALATLPDRVRFRFAGYETIGHPGYIAELLSMAEQLGIRDRVEYLGTPPKRQELYRLASQCDVGLTLFSRVFREPMVGASNKPFDYMACGLALLLPDTPEWEEFYVVQGYGRSCNPSDPMRIAEAVQWFLEDGMRTRSMGEAGRQRILTYWNYETQFEPVKRMLEAP